jgi:ATP-dependent Clp protease ATP-binding subunit ClpA
MMRPLAELTGSVEALLNQARELADARGHALAGTEHLLLAMTRQSTDSFARRLLDEVGATEPLRARIEGRSARAEFSPGPASGNVT